MLRFHYLGSQHQFRSKRFRVALLSCLSDQLKSSTSRRTWPGSGGLIFKTSLPLTCPRQQQHWCGSEERALNAWQPPLWSSFGVCAPNRRSRIAAFLSQVWFAFFPVVPLSTKHFNRIAQVEFKTPIFGSQGFRLSALSQKNPRAHKNKIGTHPPPKPQIPPPPKRRNFMDLGFSCRKNAFLQAPIKSAQPFPAPELRTKILRTRGFFWLSIVLSILNTAGPTISLHN